MIGVWAADTSQVQRFYDAITANGDYPPVAVSTGSSISLTFASEGTLEVVNYAPAVSLTAAAAQTARLGGQTWATYSAASDTITMTLLKDALTVATSAGSPASAEFRARLAEAPTSATTFHCAGDSLTLGLNEQGQRATIKLTREGSAR